MDHSIGRWSGSSEGGLAVVFPERVSRGGPELWPNGRSGALRTTGSGAKENLQGTFTLRPSAGFPPNLPLALLSRLAPFGRARLTELLGGSLSSLKSSMMSRASGGLTRDAQARTISPNAAIRAVAPGISCFRPYCVRTRSSSFKTATKGRLR